jgi:uncharacterized protein
MTPRPDLGYGVGLRAVHYSHLHAHNPGDWGVDWFEIVSEDYFDDRHAGMLDYVRAHRPVVMHGVSLNIGGADPLDYTYLRKLRDLAHRIQPVWVSDHLCWTGVDGRTSHDLLPVPRTPATLAHIAGRIRAVQDCLSRPLVLENPSSYFEWGASRIPEPEFLAQLAQRTGCRILLDVNNVHVSSVNHRFDPHAYINTIPPDSIAYLHIAGSADKGAYRLDTHDQAVNGMVWPLYALAQRRTGGVATLLEWDSDIPPFPELVAELAKAKAARGG